MRPHGLRCEYFRNPLGIENRCPRLSWLIDSGKAGERQTAWQVKVYGDPASIGRKTEVVLWNSGRVPSSESHLIRYAGQTLRSRQRCWWQVRVWNGDDEVSEWSELAVWEMGLLEPSDWQARWVTAPPPEGRKLEGWTIYLRREFLLEGRPLGARLYLTARGLYQLRVNGRPIGDLAITPDWSDYRSRQFYQTYDLTEQLQSGRNTLAVILSGGWYAGSIGFFAQRFHYGKLPWLLGQLEMDGADGLRRSILTDGEWLAAPGPVESSDLMQGEIYDPSCERVGWDRSGCDPSGWVPVTTEARDEVGLRISSSPPLRRTGEVSARSVTRSGDGWLVDFGQNLTGWVRAKVNGLPGGEITFRHGEVLDEAGELYTENLRDAVQVDRIRPKDADPVVYEPSFSLHGFRYLKVDGLAGEPKAGDFAAQVVHSDLPVTGGFRSSDPELNRVWEMTLWGQRSNFVCVPTDCPQRDERLGWTGDAQLFAPLACYNMECAGFFRKFLTDLADGQSMEGGLPEVGPRISTFLDAAPVWGDAFIIIPWLLYQMYGDVETMALHYDSMERWMDYIGRANPDGVRRNRLNGNYGDWVCLGPETDKVLVATVYWVECARLMEKMAGVLGKAGRAEFHADVRRRVGEAFRREFIRGDRLSSDTQTAYVLALRFGEITDAERSLYQRRLIELLEANSGALDTGIVGSAHLLEVLSEAGRVDLAYGLMNRPDCPSLRFMVRSGATTVWERWDAWKPDVGFQNPGMNSFNHVALGSMAVFLYRWMGGIQVDERHPGFSRFRLAPRPGGDLEWVEVTYDSVRGRILSRWERDGERIRFLFEVPSNTEAVVDLPGQSLDEGDGPIVVGGGRHRFERLVPGGE
ncbi:MAG: family 78 glycoside hydrolase catalytic domain [Opitutaceae bacterium]